MKKFLLFAVAALIAGSVSAQKKVMSRTMPVLQEKQMAKFEMLPGKKIGRTLQRKNSKAELQMPTLNVQKSLSFVGESVNKASKNTRRVGQIASSYDASGKNYRTNSTENWTMSASTFEETNEPCLVNVIPSPFTNTTEIPVSYTVDSKGDVAIPAQKVAESGYTNDNGTEIKLYVYLINPLTSSTDNSIHMTLGDDGSLTPVDGYMAYYFFMTDEVKFKNENNESNVFHTVIYYNVKYTLGGAAPTTMFDIDNAVLFVGQSVSGGYWTPNIAISGADAPVSLLNTSDGKATSWAWSVTEDETTPLTSSDANFQFTVARDKAYSDFTLVGSNGDNSSTFNYGYGHALNGDEIMYEAFELDGGGSQSWYYSSSTKTYATMTRFNPDGDLAYYSGNFGTPDLAGEENSFHKIISYQGKPSAPLYITGITLPVILKSNTSDFNLDVKLYKATEDGDLGELIATGTATAETINGDFAATSGLTEIYFPLSIEDEFGMSSDVDYLFIEDPFFVVIEGWDNGTFSAVLGAQSEAGVYEAQQKSTWFTLSGDADEDWYSWTGWNTSLFIGLDGAAYGYLATSDDTNVIIPAAGGETKINIEPMSVFQDEDGSLTAGLGLEGYTSEDIPEWLTVELDNHFTLNTEGTALEEANVDLIFKAEALPAGTASRQANLVFMQPGAKLAVTVTQGEATGISVTTKTVKTGNAQMFNLAGQRVNSGYKGLVIKNGRKFMNK